MNKIKNLLNTKGKKAAAIIIAIILFISVFAGINENHNNSKNYEYLIQAVYNEDYELAKKYIDSLPENYRDCEKIEFFIDTTENFDINDKESYINVLETLDRINSFDDEKINEIYHTFKINISDLAKQYQNDKASAQLIIEQIHSIADGDINNIKLSDEKKIQQIRETYDNSNDDIKELVTNFDYLSNAENRITALKEYKKTADAVTEKINNIGTVTLNSENAINDAYASYEKLTDEEKSYVANADDLVSAKEQFENLKEQNEREKQYSKTISSENDYNNNNSGHGTVYWVSSGEVYHISRDCPTLSRSKNVYSGSAPSGRRPCKVCS